MSSWCCGHCAFGNNVRMCVCVCVCVRARVITSKSKIAIYHAVSHNCAVFHGSGLGEWEPWVSQGRNHGPSSQERRQRADA